MGTFIILVILAALVACLGKNRNIGYWPGFFLSLVLSPLIGLIIILCSKKKEIDFAEIKEQTKLEDK